jgi:hypothetical protein
MLYLDQPVLQSQIKKFNYLLGPQMEYETEKQLNPLAPEVERPKKFPLFAFFMVNVPSLKTARIPELYVLLSNKKLATDSLYLAQEIILYK